MAALTADALRALELQHDFIVDVGVDEGTPWLYAAFPAAPFVLVDMERRPLKAHPRKLEAFHEAPVGRTGTVTLHGRGGTAHVVAGGDVPVVTLRDLLSSRRGRFGLKIDIEGADAAALDSLGSRIRDVAWLILEVPLREGVHPMGDGRTALMAAINAGFHPYRFFDCPGPMWRYQDALFLPLGHKLLQVA